MSEQKEESKHFKVLMYGWIYVDVNELGRGIYQTLQPVLYLPNFTIERIVKTHWDVQKYSGQSDEYIQEVEKNINQCKLVDVYLAAQPPYNTGKGGVWRKFSDKLPEMSKWYHCKFGDHPSEQGFYFISPGGNWQHLIEYLDETSSPISVGDGWAKGLQYAIDVLNQYGIDHWKLTEPSLMAEDVIATLKKRLPPPPVEQKLNQ